MEALTEYAYRARLRDITDMTIVVEASASKIGNPMHITSESLSTVHQMDVSFLKINLSLKTIKTYPRL